MKAFKAGSGQLLWSNDQLEYRELNAPLVFSDYVAVADAEGYLHLLDTETGAFVGRTKVDGSGVSAPLL